MSTKRKERTRRFECNVGSREAIYQMHDRNGLDLSKIALFIYRNTPIARMSLVTQEKKE